MDWKVPIRCYVGRRRSGEEMFIIQRPSLLGMAASCAFVFASMLATPTAVASDPMEDPSTPVGACVEEADIENLGQWLCVGPSLYELTETGQTRLVDVIAQDSEVPVTMDQAVNAVFRPAAHSTRTSLLGSASDRGTVLPTDAVETWCENGTICYRVVSDYIGQVKGNAAYGNMSGGIGTFDIVLNTNINGSSPRFRGIFDWDSGPKINFSNVKHNLIRTSDGSNRWSDYVDGTSGNGAFAISSSDTRDTGPLMNAPPQRNSYRYRGELTGRFDTSQTSMMNVAPLKGNKFTCHGSSGCIMDD